MFTIAPVVAERATSHTGAVATSTKNNAMPTPVPRYSSTVRCLRSPAVQRIAGTALALHVLTRREPARHPQQVGVVQLGVAVALPASPPRAEHTRVVPRGRLH